MSKLIPLSFFLFYLIAIFYLPILEVFKTSFLSDENITSFIMSPYTLKTTLFTLSQAFLSNLFSLIIGLPGAFFFGCYHFKGKNILFSLSVLSFTFPTILAILGFVIIWGNNGFLNKWLMSIFSLSTPPLTILYSMKGIIIAHMFFNFPIVIRMVGSAWMKINPKQSIASTLLGNSKLKTFFLITLPQLIPSVISSFTVIFTLCFLSFSIVLVLGGGPSLSTFEVVIYQLVRMDFDLPLAARFALLETFLLWLVLLLLILSPKYLKRVLPHQSKISNPFTNLPSLKLTAFKLPDMISWKVKSVFLLYVFLISLFIIGPILGILLTHGNWQFLVNVLTNKYDALVGINLLTPLINSLKIAFTSSTLAMIIGTFSSYSLHIIQRKSLFAGQVFYIFSLLPFLLSPLILSLGIMLKYQTFIDSFDSRIPLIFIAHSLLSYPFVHHFVGPMWQNLSPKLIKSAHLLGHGSLKVFLFIILPVLAKSMLSGLIIAFGMSMGETGMSFMLSNEESITIPLAIYRLISVYRYSDACTLGLLIVFLTLAMSITVDLSLKIFSQLRRSCVPSLSH